MYLKSIEVQGFKSFANKIRFDFHQGITGIVGPNGSGKSNVADAVRWVLGEQRVKQLRGGSMQDVIFSGTENRKPLSYAAVAITLNNSDRHLPVDYEEVTVTRKLYRSGESEYLINGSVCRLKDINEMFYDTGIGKEGYSIIGQGQIDKILNGKPEERRELFDEAAGIVKYKRRKQISLKKLEEERQNLIRVTDILSELEKQVGPLKKQSETAREYLKKKEELKVYDIHMFLLETERLKEQLTQIEGQLIITSEELSKAKIEYEQMKTEYQEMEAEIDQTEILLEKARTQKNETTLLKQQLEGEINVLKEQINTVRANSEHFDSRRRAIQEELQIREKQLGEQNNELHTAQEKIIVLSQQDKESKQRLETVQETIRRLGGEIEHGKQEIVEILGGRASTKARQQHFTTLRAQEKTKRAELNKQILEMAGEGENQKKILLKLEEIFCKAKEKTQSFVEKIREKEKEIEVYQVQLTNMQEKLRTGQTAYHRESSRLESLKNITERYDGYGNSIRRVMERRNDNPGLLGVVADIIKVEKEYESAIETALGGSIQNVVTDNEETAKRMIQYLKQNKYGRATFLPLTAMRESGGIRYPEALKEEGVIGLANTLVTVEEKFKRLSDNLLGKTIVVKHMDYGIRIARKYKQSLRLVTLDGELLNPGGAMTGGAFKNAGNLLSRRREIEEFETTVAMLKKEMDDMEQAVNVIKQKRAENYHSIDEIQIQMRAASVEENTAKLNLEQAQLKQKELYEQSRNFQKEFREIEEKLKGIRDEESVVIGELEESEKAEKKWNQVIEEMTGKLEQERILESRQQKETEEVHLSMVELTQQETFIKENIHRIEEEIQRFRNELEDLENGKSQTFVEIKEREDKIVKLQDMVVESGELFEEIQQEIEIQTTKKEELNRRQKLFLDKRETLSRHMADLDKECYRLQSRKESGEEAFDKQTNYMWDEYEMTYGHALELRNPNLTDVPLMKREIQTLKQEIKKLGVVNVNAIEDYKEVSERYEFLKKQHEDLVKAEQTLVQIVDELDVAMRKQFKEQFEKIAKEFDVVFKQLFGGGKGTLELMEDMDVLEAGIRIIAQPPGKKLQNMMQLSGGEKALTAISLLFAIQNLKPSPFCLLDEIEAALDDNNVVRYAKYLHKLTEHTQFIVITHRRGTMVAADRLYGITMQEKGVSTLVSVDLLEDSIK